MPQNPPRAKAPALPRSVVEPSPGRWLWTCRAGFEAHLFEELAWAKAEPRLLGPALVESRAVQEAPAFARMGFQVAGVVDAEPVACVRALARAGDGELASLAAASRGDEAAPTDSAAPDRRSRDEQRQRPLPSSSRERERVRAARHEAETGLAEEQGQRSASAAPLSAKQARAADADAPRLDGSRAEQLPAKQARTAGADASRIEGGALPSEVGQQPPANQAHPAGADAPRVEGGLLPSGVTTFTGPRVHVQAWAPDADAFQSLQAAASALGEAVGAQLPERAALESAERARELGAWLGQLCLLSPTRVAVGAVHARDALSLGPGGRRRMWRETGSLSRAAMKVEEALDAFGLAPGKGEQCVDLGAAPGGWTQRLLARGARVIAVDPAKLAPELQRHPKLTHVQESAFSFAPEEPVDWLFCDMAWRPLEVAQLLGKWARNGWADYLVANIKLPMNDKNPVLFRVRHTLVSAGWKQLRVRQLYHDRDEVTVLARRY